MLDPDRPYAKTDKGRLELAKRSHGLSQALRSVLILIDGKAPLRDLFDRYASISTLARDIALLHDQGYIEIVRGTVAAPQPAADSAHKPDIALPVTAKERLIEVATRLLADHARPVVAKLEKSGEQPGELSAVLDSCYKLIKLTIDEAQAERFRELGRRVLAAA